MPAPGATYILAVDLGSGGPKIAIFSDAGELIARTSGRTSTIHTSDGGGEQDPEEWWRVIGDGVRELLAQRAVPVESIVAVSIAAQWSVTVPVDADGRHLMNAIHWSDSRGAVHTDRITRGLINIAGYGPRALWRWMRMTGGVPTHSGADALAHILFIRHERPEVYRQTYKFLEPMDYLNFRLTGRALATYATVFPYLLTDNRDNTRIDYDDRLIAWCGLERAKLPDLIPVGTVLGPIRAEVADAWGLGRHVQVVAGTPDSQAGAIGSGAVRDFEAHISLGTTAWMSCHVPFKKTNILDYIATMPSGLHGRNMVSAEQGAAGKCLEVFLDNWLFADDELRDCPPPADRYGRAERLAATVPPGSGGLLFLPWLNGAGPPSGESAIRGGFLNQSLMTGRAHAIRAIMEGVAFNLRWLRKSVERFVDRRLEQINFIGGGARSDLWCQIMADVLERPMRRVADPEMAISRGAAMVGLVAMGRMTENEIPSRVPLDRTFTPNPDNLDLYAELFGEFLSSYKANRRMFRRLNATAR